MASEQFTEETKDHLIEILSREEFQPRGNEPAWYESLWSSISQNLYERLRSFIKRFEDWDIDPDRDLGFLKFLSGLGDFLSSLGEMMLVFLRYSGYVLAITILLALAYYIYRHSRVRDFTVERLQSQDRSGENIPQMKRSPVDYLAEGKTLLALVRLRSLLRERLGEGVVNVHSVTDYELQKRLGATTKAVSLFREVSAQFERVLFAGEKLHVEDVKRLCGAYTLLREQREV